VFALSPHTLDVLAIAGTSAGAVGVISAGAVALRLRRIHRGFAVLERHDGGRDTIISAVRRQAENVDQLRRELAAARADLATARGELADALRHVAVVRYDAFGDMGGRLSFSAALLDDAGDGLVLTSINGRTETRTYAKGVKAGRSDQTLSPEEEQAIAFAIKGEASAGGRRRTTAARA
jgi:hypothetical protein